MLRQICKSEHLTTFCLVLLECLCVSKKLTLINLLMNEFLSFCQNSSLTLRVSPMNLFPWESVSSAALDVQLMFGPGLDVERQAARQLW